MAPWLIFAALGLTLIVRRQEPVLTKAMGGGWLAAGILVILVQRFS